MPNAKTNLVIFESPSKAKTIGKYLGPDYQVKASMGHLRDLRKSTMSVDIDHDFEPEYYPIKGKEDIIKDLQSAAAKSDERAAAKEQFDSEKPTVIAIMNETFQRRASLGKMLILSNGYYGGIYYHGILLDAFRKHDGKRARVMMEEHLQHGLYDLESDNLGQEKNDL